MAVATCPHVSKAPSSSCVGDDGGKDGIPNAHATDNMCISKRVSSRNSCFGCLGRTPVAISKATRSAASPVLSSRTTTEDEPGDGDDDDDADECVGDGDFSDVATAWREGSPLTPPLLSLTPDCATLATFPDRDGDADAGSLVTLSPHGATSDASARWNELDVPLAVVVVDPPMVWGGTERAASGWAICGWALGYERYSGCRNGEAADISS